MNTKRKILLTGATGYIGGQLLNKLEKEGHSINCLARNPAKLAPTSALTTIFQGDVLNRSSMEEAFQGVDTAYFLVHFLAEKNGFEDKELEAALNFASLARGAGVKRIIYVGGLGNEDDGLSPHLRSRQQVGHVLRESCIPTIEFRASIVLGEGSLSFKIIRDLAEKIPVMVTPKWASIKAQPIGIDDLLDYLVQALDVKVEHNEIVEIGGVDRMSYGDLLREYARQRGLKRMMIPVPVLTPWLSGHWLSIFTDVDASVGRKLIEGMRNETVVESRRAQELFTVAPAGASEAMRRAIDGEAVVETSRYRVIPSVRLESTRHVHAA